LRPGPRKLKHDLFVQVGGCITGQKGFLGIARTELLFDMDTLTCPTSQCPHTPLGSGRLVKIAHLESSDSKPQQSDERLGGALDERNSPSAKHLIIA